MTITLKICTRKAFVVETQLLTSGSVGIEVEFSFSDAWNDLNKVAVFRGSGANIDMVLTGDSCTVPPEVLAQPGGHLMIGVYGTNGAGTIVIPTVWANAGPILLGAIPSGIEPEEITPSLLQQLLDLIHGGSSELYIVDYDQRAPTIPNVNEIAAAFDAGKAVLASATDEEGGGHVLPLTAITRENGAVTALHFYAGGWSLGVGKIGTQWLPYLSEIEQPIADLVLTFRGAWNSRTGAYYVSTDANLQHFGTALREGRHIDARLYVHPVEGDTDRFSDRVLRQGTVCVVYVGEDTQRLDTVTVSFFGEAGEIWELSGTSDGWELEQLAIGGSNIELDTTLSQPGKAADAAAVGAALARSGGMTEAVKQALLDCFEHVAWIDDQGQTYYNALYNALYPPKTVVSITAAFEQGSTVVYDSASLDSLKSMLTVTARYDDNTTDILADSAYTLSGTLEAGTSTVTVAYNGKTDTFTVNVTAVPTLSSISAAYTQSGTVYDTDTLDSLKVDLVVTAHYSDSSTQTVAATDYTLSGTLSAGTSTITVSYTSGSITKTTTFNVTVTHAETGEVEMMPIVVHTNMRKCPLYSDGGTTSYSDDRFPTTDACTMRSVRVFDNDTRVKITCAPSSEVFQCFLFSSSLWDGTKSLVSSDTEPPFYYCESSKDTFAYKWSKATHEFEYTVKAGYALTIISIYTSQAAMRAISVEVI